MSQPQIEIISPGNSKADALLGLLAKALNASAGGGGFEPQSQQEVDTLYIAHEPLKQWDVVQLREEFDCITPTLKMGVDYVVVRTLSTPIIRVDGDSHVMSIIDCTVACRIKGHGNPEKDSEDHFHYHEVGVNSYALRRIGSLKDGD